MRVSWSVLKQFAQTKSVSIQWIDLGDSYYLKVFDGPFSVESEVFKSNPAEAEQIDFEANFKSSGNKSLMSTTSPFAAKILPNGKKLFTRIHGTAVAVQGAADNIDLIIPYPTCKVTGIEIFGAKPGDTANFKVLDSSTGTYTTVPHYQLNQFGFNVNIPEKEYKYKSDYDADLMQNMVLRVEYDAADEILPRTIYVNFILHEVKD